LGGRALLQHLDMIDRGDRDQVQIGGRGALKLAAADMQIGAGMTAFAVDQNQRVVG
jgi:hypothetical protein